MKEMRCIYIVYDIQSDKIRNELANLLIFYGLHRVQYSVFNGLIPVGDKADLLNSINSLELDEGDKIHVIDLCRKCARGAIIIGKKIESKEHLIF